MDNAQKAIMIGVGLFITIIIISAVLLIVNLGTGLVDDATSELGSMSTTLQNQILQTYDGKIISGTQVRAATSQYANDAALCVVVFDKNGTVTGQTGYAALTTGLKTEIENKIGQSNVQYDKVNSTELYVTWSNATGATLATGKKTTASEFSSSTNAAYINTSKNYKSSVIRNGNDTAIAIAFQVVD